MKNHTSMNESSEFIENFKCFYLPGGIMILAVLSLIAFLGIPKTMTVMTYVKLSLGIVLTCEAILFIIIIYLFVVWGSLGDILVPCFFSIFSLLFLSASLFWLFNVISNGVIYEEQLDAQKIYSTLQEHIDAEEEKNGSVFNVNTLDDIINYEKHYDVYTISHKKIWNITFTFPTSPKLVMNDKSQENVYMRTAAPRN